MVKNSVHRFALPPSLFDCHLHLFRQTRAGKQIANRLFACDRNDPSSSDLSRMIFTHSIENSLCKVL